VFVGHPCCIFFGSLKSKYSEEGTDIIPADIVPYGEGSRAVPVG
jgi:hypothetical protein